MRPARREVAEPDPRPEPTETLEVIGDDTADIEYLIAYTGHRYRYNTLAERDELWYSDRADWSSAEHEPWAIPPLRGDDTRWEPATDDHWDSIRTIGETCFRFPKNHPTKNKRHQPWTTTDQVWKRRIGSIRRQAHRRVNPIAEWVDKQPSDDPNLIEQMLHVVLGVPDTPLNRWVSWRIFMTAIHRLRNPQARLPHEILILKGGEGTFKTLLIQNLLPVPEWVGSFSMDDNEQKMAEAFLGSLFAEWGEMATAGRYNNRHTKDMLTRQAIKVRLAWGRHPILVPVPIIIGTTNADIHPDPTGTRRFMVLPVPGNGKTGEHNLEWMNHHRPVLWGTARHQYDTLAAGTGLNTRGWNINGQPPAEFIDDIRRITSEHTGTSTAEEAAAWLTERYRGQDPLSMTDLIGTWTDGNRRPRPRNDIGQHLLNLGWEKTRGPNRERLWIPPA